MTSVIDKVRQDHIRA